MKTTLLSILLLFAVFPVFGESQDQPSPTIMTTDFEQWSVTRWTIDDGLPQNSVTSIVQAPDGHLWLGTFGGLVQFDGNQFIPPGFVHDSSGVASRIVSMHLDRDGALWLGGAGRGLLRFHNGTLSHFGPEDGAPGGPIWSIIVDPEGVIWAAGNGLSRWDGERFIPEPLIDRAVVWSMVPDPTDGILAMTSKGLLRVDSQGSRFLETGFESNQSDWWFIGHEPRPHPWLTKGSTFIDTQSPQSRTEGMTGDARAIVRASFVDRNGGWWIGASNGLFFTSSADGPGDAPEFLRVFPEISKVRAIFEDAEGNLWIGTDGDGLFRIQKRTHTLVEYHEILYRTGSQWWMAGDAEGVWCIRSGPKPKAVRLSSDGAGTTIDLSIHGVKKVNSAYSAHDGSLWISSNRSVTRIQGDVSIPMPHNLPGPITAFTEFDGILHCGGNGFVARLEPDGSWRRLASPEGAVKRFAVGDDGEIWFITNKTLYRFSDDELTDFGNVAKIPQSLRALTIAKNGDVWVGSYGGGLVRLRGHDVLTLTKNQGLPDDGVSFVAIDENGSLWANSNRGVFRLRAEEVAEYAAGQSSRVHCRVFRTGEAHGDQGWFSPEGRLVLPTTEGLAFLETRAQSNFQPAQVQIQSVSSGQRQYASGSEIELDSGDRSVRLTFSAISLGHSDQISIRYRLTGDFQWHEAITSQEIVLTKLPPGDHVVRIAARVGDGPWEDVSLQLSVPFHFYEAAWFRGLIVIGLVALVYITVRWRLARHGALRDKQASLITEVYERERRRIGRELHDDISQRIATIAMDASHGISDNSVGTARITEALQGLSVDVHRISRHLHPSMLTDLGLRRAIEAECREFSKRTGIAVTAELCDPAPTTGGQVDLALFRILQESLRNIEKHARATSVKVELNHGTRDGLTLRVVDSGRGFNADDQNVGLGFVSMRERARLIGGIFRVSSQPDLGTTIEVEVSCAPSR